MQPSIRSEKEGKGNKSAYATCVTSPRLKKARREKREKEASHIGPPTHYLADWWGGEKEEALRRRCVYT